MELSSDGIEEKKSTRSQHGIRKRTAIEIAEQSGSIYEVMAHPSHSDPKTSAIYTKEAERARLAEQAVDRVESAREARSVPRGKNRGTLEVSSPCKGSHFEGIWQPVGVCHDLDKSYENMDNVDHEGEESVSEISMD
jgi:hypothetical protein